MTGARAQRGQGRAQLGSERGREIVRQLRPQRGVRDPHGGRPPRQQRRERAFHVMRHQGPLRLRR